MNFTSYLLICLLAILVNSLNTEAQTISELRSVQIDLVSFADDSVQFTWVNHGFNNMTIYRKLLADTGWNLLGTTTASTYTDSTISAHVAYEYKFRSTRSSAPINGYGYKVFGVDIAKKNTRGDLLLVLDNRFSASLADEFFNLKLDLISDGWNPIVVTCDKDSSHTFVKAKIDSVQALTALEAVYLVGHIPVPYAGQIFPDGHFDHRGAWPTDAYYVTDATSWTDNTVNLVNASRPQNSNVIGDGKFDNSIIPTDLFAPISRVDFYNLPLMVDTEEDLLRNYLQEVSNYKHGKVHVLNQGIVDNNFLNFSEGFAFSGYMNFSSLCGSDSVKTGDMLTDLSADTYKWTYACGFGSDTNAIGVGSITDLRNTNYKGIFSMIFGSYFGDWNTPNNFMRSAMANGKMLTAAWAGRPAYFFHHMGLNQPIGLSTKSSMNNYGVNATKYDSTGFANRFISMALLGDLSLRNNHIPSIKDFTATFSSSTNDIDFTWTAVNSTPVSAYDIYVSTDSLGPYSLLQSVHPDSSSYNYTVSPATYHYYIKTIRLDTTLSGSYYNNSLGRYITVNATSGSSNSLPLPVNLIKFTAVKSGSKGLLQWTSAQEQNFSHYEVQKSNNRSNWETIGTVKGTNTSSLAKYSFIDYTLHSTKNYYRLRMVDFDHTEEYSTIRLLKHTQHSFTLHPNPSQNNAVFIQIDERKGISPSAALRVTNSKGEEIEFDYTLETSLLHIQAPAGIYFITLGDTTLRWVRL